MSKRTEYEKQKAFWYKKLKEAGFEDIESDENNLKSWSSKLARKNPPEIWQAKATYYSMARSFLNSHTFQNNLDKIIWEYHTEAISVRDIVETLNKTKVIKIGRDTVWLTIRRLENAMKKLYMDGQQDNE